MLVKLTPPLVVVPKTFGKVCPLHPVVSVQVEPELEINHFNFEAGLPGLIIWKRPHVAHFERLLFNRLV